MSHFTIMIIGAEPEKQLEPFNENLEVPRYVEATKEQLIANNRRDIENYKNDTYAKYLANKTAYKMDCLNQAHIYYLENEFPPKLEWTDEQLYQDAIKDCEPSEIGAEGEVYSERNPNSKWDWFQIGGRWTGLLKLREGINPIAPLNFSWGWEEADKAKFINENRTDSALKRDIANLDEVVCFALLKDGKWYERGKMGWWAFVSNEKPDETWDKEFKELIMGLPDDTLISIYDCHI